MENDKRTQYCKPPKKIDDLIDLLESRGLEVLDKGKMAGYLKNISYYHLSSYFKFFQKSVDVFDDGVTFDQVLNIYEFDKKLRLIVLDVTERIEKSLKSRMIGEISLKENNSHWHSSVDSYISKDLFDKYVFDCLEKAKSSKDIDFKNYYCKYNSPEYPPAWIFFESLSFGEVVTFYRNLNAENRKMVSKTFGLNHIYLTSWMFGLSVIRNVSAHHARLWDKRMFARILLDHNEYKHLFNQEKPVNVYNYFLVAHILMQRINPTSTWLGRLEGIINEHEIDVAHMGFPENWQDRFLEVELKD